MVSGLSNNFLYSAVRVHVQFSNGVPADDKLRSGTGFFVQDAANRVVLVTNRHVLDLAYSDSRYIGLGMRPTQLKLELRTSDPATGRPDMRMEIAIADPPVHFAAAHSDDVACVWPIIGAVQPAAAALSFHLSWELLATEEEFSTDNFIIGDLVGFPGYPEWYDAENFRPILRTGSLASDPRYPYQYRKVTGNCLAYEAFSFGGSSGSPVFAFQRSIKVSAPLTNPGFRAVRVIGINAGHLAVESDADANLYKSHSGISYMFRSPTILAMLKSLGT